MAADRLQRDDDCRLNLEQQKVRAKELLRAVRGSDRDACERFRMHHPQGGALGGAFPVGGVKLSDAQLVIARELGVASWPKLKAHIESLERARQAISRGRAAPDRDVSTVHIRCGSDLRQPLKEAGFVGDFLEFSDPLWLGPPLQAERAEDFDERAGVIGRATGLASAAVAAKLRREYSELAAAAGRCERIAVWCEHDSYDQLCLARVLAEFAGRQPTARVELVATAGFPAIQRFIGLGQLSPAALRLLWDRRIPVNAALLSLGTAVWAALRAPSPTALHAIAAGGTPELPMMAPALRRHLQELPWTGDGLSLTQRLALQALGHGPRTVSQLFRVTQYETEPLAFIGDLMFWGVLRDMQAVREPPFALDPESARQRWPQYRLSLTPVGEDLVAGRRDWLTVQPPERWVGGVRIAAGAPAWRWCAERREPVYG